MAATAAATDWTAAANPTSAEAKVKAAGKGPESGEQSSTHCFSYARCSKGLHQDHLLQLRALQCVTSRRYAVTEAGVGTAATPAKLFAGNSRGNSLLKEVRGSPMGSTEDVPLFVTFR